MSTTFFPLRDLHVRPAFWGVDRDLKQVMDSIENVWGGSQMNSVSEFNETEKAYFMTLDLPGVNKTKLDVQVEGEQILITGFRKRTMGEKEESEQKITHQFLMPKYVDKDKIQAHLEDGVLYLALPKLEKAQPKKIEISQDADSSFWKKLLK
jgi:HSP20 family protein